MMKPSYCAISFLTIFNLIAFNVHAADSQCNVISNQLHDVDNGSEAIKNSYGYSIRDNPPIRCAEVVFSTKQSYDKVVSWLSDDFTAIYADGSEATSNMVRFNEDDVHAGYIKMKANQPITAYVCFGQSNVPISKIECDIK
jgi:hypothetical protein